MRPCTTLPVGQPEALTSVAVAAAMTAGPLSAAPVDSEALLATGVIAVNMAEEFGLKISTVSNVAVVPPTEAALLTSDRVKVDTPPVGTYSVLAESETVR